GGAAGGGVGGTTPAASALFFGESKKPPRNWVPPPPHPSVARSGKPLLASCLAAFIRRPRQPAVARHGATVAQVARQDLPDQHVRRLDPNPNDAHQDEDHEIWCSFGGFLQLLQARLLDLLDLLGNELLARHVARQFRQRARLYR